MVTSGAGQQPVNSDSPGSSEQPCDEDDDQIPGGTAEPGAVGAQRMHIR